MSLKSWKTWMQVAFVLIPLAKMPKKRRTGISMVQGMNHIPFYYLRVNLSIFIFKKAVQRRVSQRKWKEKAKRKGQEEEKEEGQKEEEKVQKRRSTLSIFGWWGRRGASVDMVCGMPDFARLGGLNQQVQTFQEEIWKGTLRDVVRKFSARNRQNVCREREGRKAKTTAHAT